jgi:hypothetical protein
MEVASTTLRRPGGAARIAARCSAGVERAVQAIQVDVGRQPGQALGGPLDLGHAGQESEQRAIGFRQRAAAGGGHLVLDPPFRVPTKVKKRDRVRSAAAFDHRRIVHQPGEAGAVQSGGHGQQPQIGTQRRLSIEGKGKAEIAVQAALVHFVEQHGRHARKLRIGLDARQEDAFGHDQNARAGRSLAVQAGQVADRLAGALAGQFGHALGRGTGGQAARGEQQHFASAPGLGQQGRGDRRCLAGPGRRHQHRARPLPQGAEQFGQDGMDRQIGHACPFPPSTRLVEAIAAADPIRIEGASHEVLRRHGRYWRHPRAGRNRAAGRRHHQPVADPQIRTRFPGSGAGNCGSGAGPGFGRGGGTDHQEMMREAEILRKIASNIAVKVPMTIDGLKTCRALTGEGTMVNVTLCFTANQALLAAKAGATFISPVRRAARRYRF